MTPSRDQRVWGYLGATAAALFAVWLLVDPSFYPQSEKFAWNVHPRAAQLFIGGGYIFRTFFFLNAAREGNWLRLRWILWGNLAFTGTLLVATYWHLDQFHFNPARTWFGHIWIVLYIFEPITMLYLVPRGVLRQVAPATGGPLNIWFKRFLVLVTGVLLMNGLLILANPGFADTRWPWELNELDSRIVSAWFIGWSAWSGTMAFALDWDEIRRAAQLFVLCGVSLFVPGILSLGAYRTDRATVGGYFGGLAVLTVGMVVAYLWQERHRPPRAAADGLTPPATPA